MGFAAGWIGLWVVFGHANPALIAAVLAVALGVHLFVVFYEEPTLRGKFGIGNLVCTGRSDLVFTVPFVANTYILSSALPHALIAYRAFDPFRFTFRPGEPCGMVQIEPLVRNT